MNIDRLIDLPNIGKVLNEQLAKIDITDTAT
ncbi:TfoX/Sxy family protein [Companilactobacillus crustorum]|nr:TfoX/Sxy family protein [Companilactobacillus crustorum]